MKTLMVFAMSALVSAAVHLALSSCAGSDDAGACPEAPPFPAAKSQPLPVTQVQSYDAAHNDEPLSVDLSSATVELTGEQLVFRYPGDDGAERVVVYDIVGTLP